VRGSVGQSTYQRDESLCRVHIVPALGKKKLKTLNAADVQRFYRAKLDSGLSSATVHKLHVVLHRALKQAIRWGFAQRNVVNDVDAPKIHKEEVTPLTREEARKLLETARDERLEALYVVSRPIRPTAGRAASTALGGHRPRNTYPPSTPHAHEERQ
jgi:integrase